MNIETLKRLHIEARKASDPIKSSIYGLMIGEVETVQKRTGKAVDIPTVAKKLIKSNNETIALRGSDKKLEAENAALEELIPKQLTEEQLRDIIEGLKLMNVGHIMGALNATYKGQFDGRIASEIAKEYIQLSQ